MRKQMRGSFTIEAAVILPVILLIFGSLLQIFFYYHDKNMIKAMGNEIATVGEKEEEIYEEMIQEKLLLFSHVDVEIFREEEKVTFVCEAQKGKLYLCVESGMIITEPEKNLRNKKQIEEEIKS